jgi:hypothetical protein
MRSSYCCVAGCKSKKRSNSSLRFHSFPRKGSSHLYVSNETGSRTKMDRRALWEMILLMSKPAATHDRVCSHHFQKADYYLPGTCCASNTTPPTCFIKLSDYTSRKLKLRNYAIPTLKLPQRCKASRACMVSGCNSRSEEHPNKRFFTLGAPEKAANVDKWRTWLRTLRFAKLCSRLTVCSDHFITGHPSDDRNDPDFVPSLGLRPTVRIEEVNVSETFETQVDTTLEDPLSLAGEFHDVAIKQEPLDIPEDCIKVEPMDLDEFVNVKVEPEVYPTQEHSYCK